MHCLLLSFDCLSDSRALSLLTLLPALLFFVTCRGFCFQYFDAVGWAAGRASACKKQEWWGAGVVICLERGADLHVAQLMPLPLTVSCSSKIQIGFTCLVPAHPGSPGQRAGDFRRVFWELLVNCKKVQAVSPQAT